MRLFWLENLKGSRDILLYKKKETYQLWFKSYVPELMYPYFITGDKTWVQIFYFLIKVQFNLNYFLIKVQFNLN